jgi:hypothetical protein
MFKRVSKLWREAWQNCQIEGLFYSGMNISKDWDIGSKRRSLESTVCRLVEFDQVQKAIHLTRSVEDEETKERMLKAVIVNMRSVDSIKSFMLEDSSLDLCKSSQMRFSIAEILHQKCLELNSPEIAMEVRQCWNESAQNQHIQELIHFSVNMPEYWDENSKQINLKKTVSKLAEYGQIDFLIHLENEKIDVQEKINLFEEIVNALNKKSAINLAQMEELIDKVLELGDSRISKNLFLKSIALGFEGLFRDLFHELKSVQLDSGDFDWELHSLITDFYASEASRAIINKYDDYKSKQEVSENLSQCVIF